MWRKLLFFVLAAGLFAGLIVYGLHQKEQELKRVQEKAAEDQVTIVLPPVPEPAAVSPEVPPLPPPAAPETAPPKPEPVPEMPAPPETKPEATMPSPEPKVETPPPAPVPEEPAVKAVPVEANVIVLGYHQFTPRGVGSSNPYSIEAGAFERQMAFLHENGYRVVPLRDLLRFLRGEIGLSHRAVVITIDDGYASGYEIAHPILQKYGFPYTMFIYPDFIGNGSAALSWKQLKELQDAGVDIQSHSKSHPFLTRRQGKTAAEYEKWLLDELRGSKETIEKKLGQPVTALAYPYGDWNQHVEEVARAAGYEGLFTVAGNPVTKITPAARIGRFIITKQNENQFASILRQAAMTLSEVSPAPGGAVTEARPVIEAVLGFPGLIDPASVQAEVTGVHKVALDFDPAHRRLRIYLSSDLTQRETYVRVKAADKDTGETRQATWQFNYEKGRPAAGNQPAP